MERKEDARAKGWVPAIVKNIETEHSPNDENEPEAPGWIFLSELFQQQDPLSKICSSWKDMILPPTFT